MEKVKNSEKWGHNGWDSFFSQKGNRWRDKDYRYLDKVFDLSSLSGSLLDVGCALGDGLIFLKSKTSKVGKFIGTDFSSEAIEVCKNNPQLKGVDFFRHDILKPFPQKYENVICLQTIEHVESPNQAFKNLVDATKKILIAAVPYRNQRPDANHLWSFDENDFKSIFDSHCLDGKKRNIFWLLDKQKTGCTFRKSTATVLFDFLKHLFKH